MTKILLIEDDLDFASILKECLEEDHEFEIVRIIDNQDEALHFIKSGQLAGLHCVLLDLRLPHSQSDRTVSSLAGLNLLKQMRHIEHFYGTIIVLTSSRDFEDGKRALSAGCDGYLCKNAPMDHIPQMLDELKVAMSGQVMLVSSEMRHVFFRGDLSAKEARLLDLLSQGKGWSEIAFDLGYNTPKAAANIGDRVFDKLLSTYDRERLQQNGQKKRELAVEIWNQRRTGLCEHSQ